MPPPPLSPPIKAIYGIRLPSTEYAWDIRIDYPPSSPQGTISSITSSQSSFQHPSAFPLLLPSLTHPHIHLDKAFVHGAGEYAHLLPSEGTFQEALSATTEAKQRFTLPDLLKRGEWLLAESVSSGVTAMRAFVEVDHTVQMTCLDAGGILKDAWKSVCEIQLVCFAQDPIFSGLHAEENRGFMEKGIRAPQTDVIGTTPYVEADGESARRNIDWAIDRALELRRHLDFHLDYNLDHGREPLVWYVLRRLREKGWTSRTGKRVMLGHCVRLTLFSGDEWERLANEIREGDLPVSFVGLPTSDLYMASPPTAGDRAPHEKQRGTLQVPNMIREYGLDAVVGVNNVGNAFTPWGAADPLGLACLGVGVYQTGTKAGAELLYECVSTRARAAIGLPNGASSESCLGLEQGDTPDFLLLYNLDDTGCGVSRERGSAAEVAWDPPGKLSRAVVCNGRLMAKPMAELRDRSCPGSRLVYDQ